MEILEGDDDDDGNKLQQAIEYMTSLAAVPTGKSPHQDHDLDYNLLQQHVLLCMGWEHWQFESPIQYFLIIFHRLAILCFPDKAK